MSEITISFPDDTLAALNMTPEQFGTELRIAGAVKLYEMGRLSSGAAASHPPTKPGEMGRHPRCLAATRA